METTSNNLPPSSLPSRESESFFKKVNQYGIRDAFYRALIRIVPNNFNYLYYAWRKFFFGYAVITMNGVKLHLDLRDDDGLSKELILHGKRERLTVEYLLSSNTLSEGQIALDIGGNIGYYALPEANLVGKSGKVYAVEPVKGNFEHLKANVALNNFNNVETHNLAMGDKEDEIEIYIRAKKNLSSLTPLPSDEKGGLLGVERVRMTTVDTFSEKVIGSFPNLVRMDVEGYESAILEGMHKTLAHGATLLIEFHPMFLSRGQKERILELLKSSGYTRVVITLNPKARLGPVLRFLNKKIGNTGKPEGLTKEGDLKDLAEFLHTSPRVFNAFLYH